MKYIITFTITFITPLFLLSQEIKSSGYYVGYKKMSIFSSKTNEKFSMALVYPTKVSSKKVKFGAFEMNLSIGSKIADGKFPLVIISHGSGGSNLNYRDIAFTLVKNGFIVGMPLHPKNNFRNNEFEGRNINWENRPKHIIASIDTLLSSPNISKSIDKEKIAIIGHSAGGYTALASVGATANTKHIINLCKENPNTNEPFCGLVKENKIQPEKIDNPKDTRIKAIVLMAPVGVLFQSDNALEKVNLPLLLLRAQKDEELSKPYHSKLIAKNYKDKSLLSYCEIPNAGHYSFISPFPKSTEKEVGIVAKDPKGFNRDTFQNILASEILLFLNNAFSHEAQNPYKLNCAKFGG